MRSLISALALASAAAVATPAVAQDAEAPFTGPHVEVLGGYDNVEGEDAFAYGVGGGFDVQMGGAIIGLEGEFMDSTARQRDRDVDIIGDRASVSAGRDLYAGVRIGGEVSPGTFLYAKGGYTNAKAKFRYQDGAGLTLRDSVTLDGYRLGAGVEKKFSLFGPSGFAKLEYRYSNYKNADVGTLDVDIDSDRHQVVAGVGVRF